MPRIVSFALLVLLTGCASATSQSSATPKTSPPATTAIEAPAMQTVTLGIGEQFVLSDGSRLTYMSLVNDSRCPPDVQCIWAGDAEIALRWQPAHSGRAQDISLHTSALQGKPIEATVERFRIRIESLARGIAPAVTLNIETLTP